MRPKIVVVGGGWSGVGAAIAAKLAGAGVLLFERTDMLLGAGLVGGIMRNNARFTAAEEAIAMGAGDLFKITDRTARHRGIAFPGHAHANLYDVHKTEPAVAQYLEKIGIEVRLESRVVDVVKGGRASIRAIVTEDGEEYSGDAFVDATGTFGPMGNCMKYGNGCAMCVQRCPSFGPRVSLAGKMGIREEKAQKTDDVFGAMSGSCKIAKESLAPSIARHLSRDGVYTQEIPPELIARSLLKLKAKACQQYALDEYAKMVVLLDTGHAKLMTPYFPLEDLRSLPGFEKARYVDPYSGGRGNSMRFMSLAPRDQFLRVDGTDNLFCGGEKAGVLVGHTEAIVTGTLAGHNAVRRALALPLLGLPRVTAIGEYIAHSGEAMRQPGGLSYSFTFAGSVAFENLRDKGLYTTDVALVRQRIDRAGLTGIFRTKLA